MTGVHDALARANADIYYQRNAGMLTGLVAHFARRHGRRFVYGAGSDTDFSYRDVLIQGVRDKTMFMYGLRRAHGVVVQNDAQLETARRSVRAPVVTIPNGVLPAEHSHANLDGPVLWAGGLRDVKRPDLFIALARRFPAHEFLIVGGPTTASGAYAARIAEEAKTVRNVRMTGWLPNSGVIREIARAAVVVNTSQFEGFPNVYLEAWNHGVPVISFNDVDGLLADEKLGALCADLDDMETKLRALLEDPATMREVGVRARRMIEQRFSPAVLGPRYVSFLESIRARD
jgi:glycosyltransferase involved in cell wall biosynthesis